MSSCSETISLSHLRYKKNLKALCVVQPTNFIKVLWDILKPLIRYGPLSVGIWPGGGGRPSPSGHWGSSVSGYPPTPWLWRVTGLMVMDRSTSSCAWYFKSPHGLSTHVMYAPVSGVLRPPSGSGTPHEDSQDSGKLSHSQFWSLQRQDPGRIWERHVVACGQPGPCSPLLPVFCGGRGGSRRPPQSPGHDVPLEQGVAHPGSRPEPCVPSLRRLQCGPGPRHKSHWHKQPQAQVQRCCHQPGHPRGIGVTSRELVRGRPLFETSEFGQPRPAESALPHTRPTESLSRGFNLLPSHPDSFLGAISSSESGSSGGGGEATGALPGPHGTSSFPPFFFFYKFIYVFFFWLCWVFIAAHGLSLVVSSGGHSSLRCTGFSLRWLLLLQSTGSRRSGSVVVARGLSSCGSRALERRLSSCSAQA